MDIEKRVQDEVEDRHDQFPCDDLDVEGASAEGDECIYCGSCSFVLLRW